MVSNASSPFLISDSDEEIIESKKITEPLSLKNFENKIIENSLIKSDSYSLNVNISTEKIPVLVKNRSINEDSGNELISNIGKEFSDLNAEKFIGLLVLRNLSHCVYFEHLWELFEPFGELESASVFTKTNKVGFVKFKNADDATRAVEILQGVMLFNQPLNIRTGLGDSRSYEKQKAKVRKERLSKLKNDEIISSRFLLATNVFEKSMFHENSTLARRLYVDFLNIISYSKSSIYHMFIDEYSEQGAIYMAALTVKDAKLVFKALNGCLYESRKVVVDCIPSHLYIHLFPIAAIPSPPLKTD